MFRYSALVTRVIDGDTVKVAIDLGFNIIYQTTIRLAGIDTAELRSKDSELRKKAAESKIFLENKVLNKEIILKSLKTEKYGRYLAFLYTEDGTESVNDEMVRLGLAKSYGGEKRT